MKFRGERASVLWWIGIGLVLSMLWAGCGGDSGRTVPEQEDPPAPPVPSAPVATITQGYSVEDALGNALRLVVNYTLLDQEEDLASVEVDYSLRTCTDVDFSPFQPAPEGVGSEGTVDLTTVATPPGQVHTFVLDAVTAGLAGAGPVDVLIRITPSDANAVGLPVTSGLIHVGAAAAEVVLGTSPPALSPSFGNQVPVTLRRNNLQVDEVTVVARFQPGAIAPSGVPVVLGPVAIAVGATISGIVADADSVEFTVGGGAAEFPDGVLAYLQFDIAGGVGGGSFPIICVPDVPTGTGTRGRFMGERQCVDCADTDGAVLLAGPSPTIAVGTSPPLSIPSTNNCVPVSLSTNGVIMDAVTVTVGYDPVQVRPAAVPVVEGPVTANAGAGLLSTDVTVPGEVTFSVGGGGTFGDGHLASVCFDVLGSAVIGAVPLPCLEASAADASTPQPILCGGGGVLSLGMYGAALSIGDYTVPEVTDPATGCLLANLGTVGDPTIASPGISNTVDLVLDGLGSQFDYLQGEILFDSGLLACSATLPTGGVALGSAQPGTTALNASCDDDLIGPGLGVVTWELDLSGSGLSFTDGVVATLTFDVPAPSPDGSRTPSNPVDPAITLIQCDTVVGAFAATAPSIACGASGSFQIRPSCITRHCTGLQVFSDAGPDEFTLPATSAATGPVEFGTGGSVEEARLLRWVAPPAPRVVILTGIGNGGNDGADDTGDQQLEVYCSFSEPPILERITPATGALGSGGSTTYQNVTGNGAVDVDVNGLVTARALNCCDTILITYEPDFVHAAGDPCSTYIEVCVDAAGPDDVNTASATNRRLNRFNPGDVDATIPGMPSGIDPDTLVPAPGPGNTFDYMMWVNATVGTGGAATPVSIGAYDLEVTYDSTVLVLVESVPQEFFVSASSMDLPAAHLVSESGPGSTVRFNDFDGAGSTETGIFELVGLRFTVAGAGTSGLQVTIHELVDNTPGSPVDLAPGAPLTAVGASTTSCVPTFP